MATKCSMDDFVKVKRKLDAHRKYKSVEWPRLTCVHANKRGVTTLSKRIQILLNNAQVLESMIDLSNERLELTILAGVLSNTVDMIEELRREKNELVQYLQKTGSC